MKTKINYSAYRAIFLVILISTLTAPCFVVRAKTYPDGTLIRAENDYKIYLVFNGKKRWLKNIDIFNSYGFKWQDIKMVNPAVVERMPLNNLVRMKGDIKVYALNYFGYKRHIINPSIFKSYNLKWDDVADVSTEELDIYPESYLVREAGNPKVYFLEDNRKRWIDSIESFYTHNLNWEAVHIVNEDDINSYQLGEVVTLISFVKGWSETPSAVPAQPATPAELAQPTKSESTATTTVATTTTQPTIPATATTTVATTTTQPTIPATATTTVAATTTQPTIPATPVEPNISTPSWSSSSANKQPGTKKWEFTVDDSYGGSGTSAIDSNGTIYFGTGGGKLIALNSSGVEKWRFSAGINRIATPTIGADGTIYVGSFDSKLYAINSNGTLKWFFNVGSAVYSSPAIADDGTIYFGSYDKKLYALNPNGSQKWVFTTGDIVYSSPAIADDGTIYFGSLDNKVYALNPDGTQKWVFTTGSDVYSSPAINTDGTIYVGSEDKKLYALNPNGTQKWIFVTNGGITSSPAIADDGTIYFGSYDKKLYALNPNGSQKWIFNASSPTGGTDGILSSPLIDSNGVIYFGNRDYNIALQAVNPDGTLKWSFPAGGWITNSPAIDSDGTVYVGADDYKFYAINTASSGLASSSWPKFHKNNYNTGRFSNGESATDAISPSVPSALTASMASYGGVTALKWSGGTNNITEFRVFSRPQGTTWSTSYDRRDLESLISTANNTIEVHIGLVSGATGVYEYKVQACNSAGCSADSNTASVNVNNFARSITILYPNGGEIFTPGSTFSIKLTIPNDQSYGVNTFLMPQGSTPVNYSPPLPGTSGVVINPVVGGYGFCGQASNYPKSQMSIGCDINSFYPAGTYKIRAYLLPRAVFDMDISSILNSAIAQDESDNVFSIAAATIETKPDLIIDNITIATTTSAVNLPAYYYRVYVKNNGLADANKSSLKVTISPSQPQSINNGADYVCSWGANFVVPCNDLVTGDILKAGETERAGDYFNPVTAGSVTITATADIYGVMDESNETNNTMTKTFSVEQLIDLGKCPNVCTNNICIAVLSNEAIAKEQMAGILVSGVLKSTLDEAEKIKFKFTKFLQRGTRGNEVKKLQEFLKTYFNVYPDGLATGYFGLLTEAAVKRLQEKEGIEPLGIVGPKTRERLNKLISLGI